MNSLKAEPEINQLVACIMGWEYADENEWSVRAKKGPRKGQIVSMIPPGSNVPELVPKFSTDPAACKIVKEWLREQSIWFRVDFVVDSNVEAIYCDDEFIWEEASTEELAVCRFLITLSEQGVV